MTWPAVVEAGGELGRDLDRVDWSATPLGPPESWPDSLLNVLRVVVSSRFAMWMAWGPELTFFCNDAYRRDTLGTKYPWALGRPASEVWGEIWDDVGPRIASGTSRSGCSWNAAVTGRRRTTRFPTVPWPTRAAPRWGSCAWWPRRPTG